jgi:hypothetical protein
VKDGDDVTMSSTGKTYMPFFLFKVNTPVWFLSLLVLTSVSPLAKAAVQVPAEVEAQAQILEERFIAVLTEECPNKVCAPVGCEVLGFKTLDQKQNSSLPGLDVGDDVVEDLHFRLSSARCDFTYESTLSADAVSALRQRLNAKLQRGQLNLAITGRKLNALGPALQAATGTGQLPAAAPAPPIDSGASIWTTFAPAISNAMLLILGTIALVTLIWAFRRVGKSNPVTADGASLQKLAPAADASRGENASASTEAAPAAHQNAITEPSAIMMIAKRDQIAEQLRSNPQLTEPTFLPIIAKENVADLCRVLQHFGPELLAPLSQRPEYREVFAEVRKRFQEDQPTEKNSEIWAFLERIERLLSLSQLGRDDISLQNELKFLSDLTPDEFNELVRDLNDDELMVVLSFVPGALRARYLNACTEARIESYVKHVLLHPRLPDQLVRQIASRLRASYCQRHAEIKSVSLDQIPMLEQLLNILPAGRRDRLVRQLKTEQPSVFEQLLSGVLLDGALAHAPDAIVNEIFLHLSPEEGAAYLNAHTDRTTIMAKLKGPLAKSISLHSSGTLHRIGLDGINFVETENSMAEKVREKITEVLKEKSRTGALDLRSLNEASIKTL